MMRLAIVLRFYMNVVGLGNDIVQTSRIARLALGRLGPRFARRVLHPIHELPRYTADERGVRLLASTWAAKEAMFKSLSAQEQTKCVFKNWYRCTDQGRRTIRDDDYMKRHPSEDFLLTISHDGEYTTAVVLRLQSSH
uniref:ARAD1D30624p n=1 Tax=Blastobotrys adeninivorans TaxID=409370 RepID=A0A060TGH8_BLAAD